MRVLVVHNRYRIQGGEERSVELQLEALRHAGVAHALLERRSSDLSRAQAARALLRGGRDEDDVEAATRELRADVVHVHNMLPLPGPRGLEAARSAGASVLLHLHNLRLFCAIGVAARDGGPCFRCHHRNTLPGLALNCRGSLPEAAVYAVALARHQPAVFEAVDRFVVPSSYAAGQSALLGVPADRLDVLPHYLPAEAFAERAGRPRGATRSWPPGSRPRRASTPRSRPPPPRASRCAWRVRDRPPRSWPRSRRSAAAPVEFTGRLERASLARELAGAAMLLMPSRYHEFAPYSALEAMAAGVPVIASALGGLPELVGAERCVPPGDPAALAARMSALWGSPELRRAEGDELIARARAGHGEERYVEPPPGALQPRSPVVERVGHRLLERDRRGPAARLGEQLRRSRAPPARRARGLVRDRPRGGPRLAPRAVRAPRSRARSWTGRCTRCRRRAGRPAAATYARTMSRTSVKSRRGVRVARCAPRRAPLASASATWRVIVPTT